MNIEQIIKGFERTHITMDLRRYADNTYMADATADKFNTYRSGWVDGQEAIPSQAQQPTLKNNEFIPDSIEGRIQAAIKCLNLHWVSHDANRFDYAIEGLEKCLVDLASQEQQAELSSNPLQLQIAFNEWISKTDFVQKDEQKLFFKCLGMHRADAMRSVIESQASRIASLEQNLSICSSAHSKVSIEVESLREQLERSKSIFQFLASHEAKDAEGFELGIVRIKLTDYGSIQQWLWVSSDLREIHAAMEIKK